MATLRTTKPSIQCCYRSLRVRYFHTGASLAAKHGKPARSPRIVEKSRTSYGPASTRSPGTLRVPKVVYGEAALPPVGLVQHAYKSGALSITPEIAFEVLRQYQERELRPSPGWQRKLCSDYHISIFHLTLLGKISMRSSTDPPKHLGQRLLLSASSLGEKTATFMIIDNAIATSNTEAPQLDITLQQLTLLAKKEDPMAMVLYGQILAHRGKDSEAMKLFRAASEAGPDFSHLGAALVLQSEILLKRNDTAKAEPILRKAAFELDQPDAYRYLARLQVKGSVQQETYLLKAASSGDWVAAGELGILYASKIMDRPRFVLNPIKVSDGFGTRLQVRVLNLAIAWFEVGAAGGDVRSMLNLASIDKCRGNAAGGLKWLEMAEKVAPEYTTIQDLRGK